MSISDDDVSRVARLSNLELSSEELETFTEQLKDVLAYVARLDALSTEAVEGTAHSVSQACPQRKDEVSPSMARDEFLRSAPNHDQQFVVVPKVIGS